MGYAARLDTAHMIRRSPPHPVRLLKAAALACLWSSWSLGCKSQEVRLQEADQEVGAILAATLERFHADPEQFTIDVAPQALRERIQSGAVSQLGPLDLPQVLGIAAGNSRQYQDRKEALFLAALQLTLERYAFAVQTKGTLGALLSGSGDTAESVSVDGGLAFERILGTGAEIVGSIGLNLFRSLTSSDSPNATTSLSLAVTQPLLRGFGRRIVLEPLTQAERDVVYAARAYERFRRTFAVDTTTRYWRILQQVDIVENERQNVANLEVLRSRNEALAQAGRLSDIQVDQARQDELRSRDRLIGETAQLELLQDQFKVFLGLPPKVQLVLDGKELQGLSESLPVDAEDPKWQEEVLAGVALRRRLDYLTSLDEVDDAKRRIEVAVDGLRTSLDVVAKADIESDSGQPLSLDSNDLEWSLGLEVDLPIDRLAERNALRAALIARDQARREAELLGDQIRSDLRDDLRQVRASLQAWRIQLGAVELASRRVESTNLNLEAGRADTRDILEAQEALVEAQNAATQALVDHRLAILSLWLSLEILQVDGQGLSSESDWSTPIEKP